MQTIDGAQTGNDYTQAATIQDVWGSAGGFAAVSVADVYMEVQYGGYGEPYWTEEVHVQQGTVTLGNGAVGVRFRSYTLGAPATITAGFSEKGEPTLILGSGGQASAVGSLTSAGNVIISADNGGSGSGAIIFQTHGGQQRGEITNNGTLQIGAELSLISFGIGEVIEASEIVRFTGVTTGYTALFAAEGTMQGTSPTGPTTALVGFQAYVADPVAIANHAVTGAINNGAGLVRLTVVGHGLTSGDRIGVVGVTGTTEANGAWQVTVIDANTIDLIGSAFVNPYVAGGTVTNRGAMYGALLSVAPTVARGGLTGTAANGDDVDGLAIDNRGTAKATDAIYVSHNSGFAGSEWLTGLAIAANCDDAILIGGTVAFYGIELANGSYGLAAIHLPNNSPITARNAAGSADIELFRFDGSNNLTFHPTQVLATGAGHTVDDVISFLQTKGLCKQV